MSIDLYHQDTTEFQSFRNRKVLVTGGAGLVGSAFFPLLLENGAAVRTVRHERPLEFTGAVEEIEGDLLNLAHCRKSCRGMDTVIHAAGVSGGSKKVTIDAIPMFTDNLLMNTNMLEAARLEGVNRYLFISNSSVYAKSDRLLSESDAWGETCRGIPENETGMVKRAGETQCALYARFTGMQIAIIRAGNAYGPHDNFDLEASHVIPALIRKAVQKQDPYIIWGSGEAVRDFIHTHDIARGGLFLLENHAVAEPVNIASGRSVSINEVAKIILSLTFQGEVTTRHTDHAPPASPVKLIDLSKMRALGFVPEISLEEGLHQTVQWFMENGEY